MQVFERNAKLTGNARLERSHYRSVDGLELPMTLLLPWDLELEDGPRHPLLLFIQGSAWTTPDHDYQLPQLAAWAQRGYVVASIGHRSAVDGHPFPAFLIDVKAALCELRAEAARWRLDPERVVVWGTSSGGNAALLMALTADEPRYRLPGATTSDRPQLVVDCFGPADIDDMLQHYGERAFAPDSIFSALFPEGARTPRSLLEALSPRHLIAQATEIPPILVVHGDADPVVPYRESRDFVDALTGAGHAGELIRVRGAGHEGDFWSPALHRALADWVDARL